MLARLLLVLVLLGSAAAQAQAPKLAKATFGAGCFWCTEEAFDKVPGVTETVSGYMGGKIKEPTYEQVSSGASGHVEVLQVTYDPAKVKYETLLETFWLNHDPTVNDRQFCDRGSQYRPVIFYHDAEQKRLAEASKARWEKDKPFKQKLLTPIEPASEFWKAEDYHQDYYMRNPVRYRYYATGCGRYSRLDDLWGKYRKK